MIHHYDEFIKKFVELEEPIQCDMPAREAFNVIDFPDPNKFCLHIINKIITADSKYFDLITSDSHQTLKAIAA